MSEKIVQLNEEIIKGQLKELVRGSVEETLNELLEKQRNSYGNDSKAYDFSLILFGKFFLRRNPKIADFCPV